MAKTLYTLVLLLIGQSTFSSPIVHSDFSEVSGSVLSSTKGAEKVGEGSEIEFTAGLLKELYRINMVPEADFSFCCKRFLLKEENSGGTWKFIPNLTTAKILYPFHSFP